MKIISKCYSGLNPSGHKQYFMSKGDEDKDQNGSKQISGSRKKTTHKHMHQVRQASQV